MRIPTFIQAVSRGFLDNYSLDGGKTECYGLFLCRLEEEHYIAVNNSPAQRMKEEFRSPKTACLWLQGHTVLNYYNQLCNGLTGEKILEAAERVRAEIERG